MKELLLKHWKQKIGSLLVAIAIWYLIKSNLERVPKGRNNPYPIPGRTDERVSLDPDGRVRFVKAFGNGGVHGPAFTLHS